MGRHNKASKKQAKWKRKMMIRKGWVFFKYLAHRGDRVVAVLVVHVDGERGGCKFPHAVVVIFVLLALALVWLGRWVCGGVPKREGDVLSHI